MVTFEHFAVSFVPRVGLFVSAFPCTGDALQEFLKPAFHHRGVLAWFLHCHI